MKYCRCANLVYQIVNQTDNSVEIELIASIFRDKWTFYKKHKHSTKFWIGTGDLSLLTTPLTEEEVDLLKLELL